MLFGILNNSFLNFFFLNIEEHRGVLSPKSLKIAELTKKEGGMFHVEAAACGKP